MNHETQIEPDPAGFAHAGGRAFWSVPKSGHRGSLRRSLLLLLMVALVPLLLLGVARSTMQLQRNQDQVEQRLADQAAATARAEREVITTAEAVLKLLADNADVRSGGILCDLALARAKEGFAAFSNFARFGADGALQCSATQPVPQASVTHTPWWNSMDTLRTFFVTGPHWGRMSQRKVFIGVLSLAAPDGAFDGVLTASIDIGWMERSLRLRALGDSAVALVLNAKGEPLLANREVTFGTLNVRLPAGQLGEVTDTTGQTWTYAVAPLVRSFDGKQALHVAYAMPRAQLFSWAWWQAGLTVAQPLIAVLLASLVIWFGTSRLVLRWLNELRLMARAFAAGNFRAGTVNFDSAPAEFRIVAASLFKMGQSIERRDSDLRAALEQQRELVREVHHRVKNNLQVVTSLLSLQTDRLDSESAKASLTQTQLRISTLSLVHRILYESGEQATVSSSLLLGEVCKLLHQMFRMRGDVQIHCRFEDYELSLDAAVPISLWLVEAASNALAHAYPDGRSGQVMASLDLENGSGLLRVSDDGAGFAFDLHLAPKGRGLRMLSGIGKQLGGVTEIVSTPGEGTLISLRYPLARSRIGG